MAYRASLRSPFFRLVYELVSKNRLDSPPLLSGRHQLIDPPLCGPSEYAEVLADFSARLEAIVVYCERIGAVPILIIPPAGEAEDEPSRSTLPQGVTAVERQRLVAQFQQARALEAAEPARSQSLYRAILDRHPDFAEAHFRLGRLLLAGNQRDQARQHFLEALDDDGLPIRCQRPFRDVYRQVAAWHQGCILVDGRAVLMANSPTGLLDGHVMQDTHHPNLRGYLVLCRAVLRELRDRRVLANDLPVKLPLEPAECCTDFELDAERLAEACERTSVHYKRVAAYRYDPTERLEKSRHYADAARRLRAGASPCELDLRGLDFLCGAGGSASLKPR